MTFELHIVSPTIEAIYRSYERHEDERTYLGASVIGDPCERKLWIDFRWVIPPEKFDGRMRRLFETGHREEARMITDLRAAGVEVWDRDENGGQIGVGSIGGHFKGHLDGVALGLLEAPKTPHVAEFKTHNAKSFANLLKSNVAIAKPKHYAQMMVYMHLMSFTRAVYMAHNKDTDALHIERVKYDPLVAAQLMTKAERVITAYKPPEKLHDDITKKLATIDCSYCHAREFCHGSQWPRRHCRTCIEATPRMDGDGRWTCDFHKCDLSPEDQRKGCKEHRFIPELIHGYQTDADPETRSIVYAMNDGSTWVDGNA